MVISYHVTKVDYGTKFKIAPSRGALRLGRLVERSKTDFLLDF
jgi:hypothetical protein